MKVLLFAVALAIVATMSSAALAATSLPGPVGGAPAPRTIVPVGGAGAGALSPAYDAEALRGATYLGPAHLGWMSIDVVMQMRDEQGLLAYARAVSDPHSRYYRHFLGPEQIGDLFGAPRPAYERTARYFLDSGLGVRTWKQRLMLRVVGSQQNLERALDTHMGWFAKNGVTFFGPVSAPRTRTALAVRGFAGIVNFHRMRRPLDSIVPPRKFVWGPGFLVGSSPFDIGSVFDYTGAYNISASCCKGNGITIGIVGTGPISQYDVPLFKQVFNVQGGSTVTQVNVTDVFEACCYSNGLETPPPVTPIGCVGPLPACNPEDGEAQLDTEQTSSLAPGVSVLFYLAYNPNECYAPGTCPPGDGQPELGIGLVDDEFQQIVNDNAADVVSASFGEGEQDYASVDNPLLMPNGTGAEPDIFAAMATEGMAIFFSSGDSGAEGCQRDGNPDTADIICADYPASDLSVVAVGGTNTPVGSNGRLLGILSAWGIATQTGGAGGGAFSDVMTRPAYQPTGSFCDSSGEFCNSSNRLVPDIAIEADPATGVAEIANCITVNCTSNGQALLFDQGGTSASSQEMAAMWALVLEACKQTTSCGSGPDPHSYRLGNPAPLLYSIYGGSGSLPYQSVFYDITYGDNAVPNSQGPGYSDLDPGFLAGPGYDLTTGLGAPFARNLIKVVTGM